ncbi:MAG: hypothetical protein JW750_01315 [Anaerolineaceae bacterium]|nr:hypothetical protein [Anaerolineaceae bacterium]
MNRRSLVVGVLLILGGAVMLLVRFNPALQDYFSWPLIIVAVGLVMLVSSLFGGNGDLAVPGFINLGVGGILFYQNWTGDWTSWGYLWTLIPGFIGLGILSSDLINRKKRIDRSGVFMILFSVFCFGAFYVAKQLGIDPLTLWPAAIILVGLMMVLKPLFRQRTELKEVNDNELFE